MNIIKRSFALIDFSFFYLKEVILSNIKVAIDVLTPRHLMRPAFLHLKVDDLTDKQLMIANNLITMTPGTLCADYDSERKVLIIHSMYSNEKEEHEQLLRTTYLTKIKNAF